MSYISDIFERADLQQYREYLLRGVTCIKVSGETYEQRLAGADKEMMAVLKENLSSKMEVEAMMDNICGYMLEHQNVYLEIGLKCGASLMAQLLSGDQR